MKLKEGICDMCGNYVGIRQKAHIISEGKNSKVNTLLLCPSCHIIFDTQLKPKLYKALSNAGVKNMPPSWCKSIYEQAAEASIRSRTKKK